MVADNNGGGNVRTPAPEKLEIVIHNGNGENSQEDPKHDSPTSEQLPGNVVDIENGENLQDRETGENLQDRETGENLQLGIYKLYALSQAGILAAPSSTSKHFKWSRFMLSGLVSIGIIIILLIQFCQQFRQRQGKEYNTWVAQKAAIVVMLVAVSLCLLVSFIP